jgi:hypothetical protein
MYVRRANKRGDARHPPTLDRSAIDLGDDITDLQFRPRGGSVLFDQPDDSSLGLLKSLGCSDAGPVRSSCSTTNLTMGFCLDAYQRPSPGTSSCADQAG